MIGHRGIELLNFVLQSTNNDWRKQSATIANRIEKRVQKKIGILIKQLSLSFKLKGQQEHVIVSKP